MKSKEKRKLVHDLSRCRDVDYYTSCFALEFLKLELRKLSEQEYPYKAAVLMLKELEKSTDG